MLGAVEAYAAGIQVNREAIEEAMGQIDPAQPGVDAGPRAGGHLHARRHPGAEGRAGPAGDDPGAGRGLGLPRGRHRPPRDRLPNVVALGEAFRRRRAAGGPAEQTFAALVGLELRPRRLREATALWAALTEHRGIAGRDALWGHPDLLPSADDFADPEAYAQSQLDLGSLEDFPDFERRAPAEPAEPGRRPAEAPISCQAARAMQPVERSSADRHSRPVQRA